MTSTGFAEVITVDVTVKAIDATERSITVTKTSKTKSKDIELEVGKTVKILVGGKEAALDSVKPGQKATVSYESDLEVITKIEITDGENGLPDTSTSRRSKSSSPKSKLVELSELTSNTEVAQYPWLSEDGLTIYWEGAKSTIWTAHRDDSGSQFVENKMVMAGRHPTLSADQLEMILLVRTQTKGEDREALHFAKRATIEKAFPRPTEISELRGIDSPKSPSLSSDGLRLYFNQGTARNATVVFSSRSSKAAAWEQPTAVKFAKGKYNGVLTWSSVSSDGLTLFCSEQLGQQESRERGNIMVWRRTDSSKPFDTFEYVEPDDLDQIVGRSPRYVKATKELFFTRIGPGKSGGGICVITNYVPSSDAP